MICSGVTPVLADDAGNEFEKHIRPIFAEHCFNCHNSSIGVTKGGLALDTLDGIRKGGNSGPLVVPADPASSLIVKAVGYKDDSLQMPPKGELPAGDVALIAAWAKAGAPLPAQLATIGMDFEKARQHWAYRPVLPLSPITPTVMPASVDKGRSDYEIDKYINDGWREHGLKPVSVASKVVLLRRATFDLTGLPPTEAEIDSFLADKEKGAFSRLIDKLLDSPRYGERWGRHWLDLVRYSDTGGDSADFPVPQAYRYRDYVVHAFSTDKPYDQFIREQLAGDLLPANADPKRREQLIATGFIALSKRNGVEFNNDFHLVIDDTIDTTGRAFLGLTLGCARCHDHKFDPIPTRDYYGLYGIFASTKYPSPGCEKRPAQVDFPCLLSQQEQQARRVAYEKQVEDANKNASLLSTRLALTCLAPGQEHLMHDLQIGLGNFRKIIDAVPNKDIADRAYAVGDGVPKNSHLFKRGDPNQQGEEIPRHLLQILGGTDIPFGESGRVQLADFIASKNNPLTARVMVNRIWQHHFGRGLVASPNDFGVRGARPSNPKLLDYLAAEFVKSGWSVKSMHRLIMNSHVYQLSSDNDDKDAEIDAASVYLWRFNRQRIDCDEYRDSMLSVSGMLDLTPGGPFPFPAENSWKFSQHNPFEATYTNRKRSLYGIVQRSRRPFFFDAFDGADPNVTVGERSVTITPMQALFALNGALIQECSDNFAKRIIAASPDDKQRLRIAFRLAYARGPDGDEADNALAVLARVKALNPNSKGAELTAWSSYLHAVLGSNEFLFYD